MAPARTTTTEEDDPVTAEYDIFLTPSSTLNSTSDSTQQQNAQQKQTQIYLLQHPNRSREKPYAARYGHAPSSLRIKPHAGYFEMDINTNTDHNFNRYKGLKWGEAMRTIAMQQKHHASTDTNEGGAPTFGMASGFQKAPPTSRPTSAGRGGGGVGGQVKSEVEREGDLAEGLRWFHDAESEGRVWHTQTLGAQIIPHSSGVAGDAEKPVYFVGAFRGSELHLSKVDATAQLRPQFHHVDAEDARARLAAAQAHAAESGPEAPAHARVITQTYKHSPASGNPKGELEAREQAMRAHLKGAQEERWVELEFVDEDDEGAYKTFEERLFVRDTSEEGGCARLRTRMGDEEFLDAVSAPGRESPSKRRKRRERRREEEVEEGTDGG